MRELGSTIECYRGETFDISRKLTNSDGSPFYVTADMKNPYIRFTVKSNTYPIDEEYKKNYWLELPESKYTGVEQFPNNKIIPTGTAHVFTTDNLSGTQIWDETSQPPTPSNNKRFAILSISPDKILVKSCHYSGNDAATAPHFVLAIPVPNLAEQKLNITVNCTLPGSQQVGFAATDFFSNLITSGDTNIPYTYVDGTSVPGEGQMYAASLNFVLQGSILYLYVNQKSYSYTNTETNFTINFSSISYNYEFDKSKIYYLVDEETLERTYYVWNGTDFIEYEFVYQKKFYNYDTAKWISSIYQYEIALCTGVLMTDWLKSVFNSLYPGESPPKDNESIAHYICKKRPDLLKDVKINELYSSYLTNQVIQKPSKLVVKEN